MALCYPRPPTTTNTTTTDPTSSASSSSPHNRSPTTLRPLSAELSSLSHADGSASLQVGNTHILCAVHGPMAPRMSKFERYDRGVVSVAFSRGLMVNNTSSGSGGNNVSSFDGVDGSNNNNDNTDQIQQQQQSNNNSMKSLPISPPPGLGATERELEYTLRDALSSCIILDRYPRCVIQIVIQVVQADGSVLGSAVNCAVLALLDAGVAMWGMPVASTCVVIPRSCYSSSSSTTHGGNDADVAMNDDGNGNGNDNTIWLDPTAEEEGGVGHAIVVAVTDASNNNVNNKQSDGGIITSYTFGAPLSLNGLLSSMKCMKDTSSVAMVAFMRLAVERKVQREIQTLWS